MAPANTSPTNAPSPQPSQESQTSIDGYREKVRQCLLLGHYTKGGPYVLETLILYSMAEVLLSKDTEVGVWILAGNMVQIAMHSGYHRDAKHFPNISPFAGEIRRRVWMLVVQLDFTISTQLGLPRLVKQSQTDTAEPRNLADSDFDEHTLELPSCRPETDMTPILYNLAKLRLIPIGGKIADIATEPHQPSSYTQILELDRQLDAARDALPSSMKWEGLATCIAVSSQVIIQRIWLEVSIQRQKIVLHKKFLAASRLQSEYSYSRSACLTAAVKILELQHLIDEETRFDGRLYQCRWRVTSTFTHDFLVATSTLCFYIQQHREQDNQSPAKALPVGIDGIEQLLRASQIIWHRESAVSREARKAAAALRYVLGDCEVEPGSFGSASMTPGLFYGPSAVPYFRGELRPGLRYTWRQSFLQSRGLTRGRGFGYELRFF